MEGDAGMFSDHSSGSIDEYDEALLKQIQIQKQNS